MSQYGEGAEQIMRSNIYIAGKVTGDPDYKKKFIKAEDALYDAGYEPFNPAASISCNEEWQNAMKKAIRLMMSCDGVALLPDWKKSKGAKIEAKIAKMIDLPIMPLKSWLKTGIRKV